MIPIVVIVNTSITLVSFFLEGGINSLKILKKKVGSQEIPGVTGKFGLGLQNEAGQRLTEVCQRTHWS